MRFRVRGAVTAVLVAVAAVGSIAGGTAAGAPSVIQPVRPCSDLGGDVVLPEAAVHVTQAAVVPAGAGVPEHCDVFRRAGGKLILWHGWADQAIPPTGTLDYYQRLWQHAGGLPETQQWARLFMVPTMYHCVGGDRLGEFDPFRELVTWVERGTPPDKIIANQRDDQGNVVRSRPVFPYPVHAQYGGTGSIDDAKNFVPSRPLAPPRDVVEWAGADLYTAPAPVLP